MDIYIRKTPYNGPILGVVLDWAGTAVDYGSMSPATVLVEVFKKYRLDVSIEEARAFMGLKKKDHIRAMCQLPSVAAKWGQAYGRKPNEDDVEKIYLDTEPMMISAIIRHADLIPGLLETIKEFRKRGIKIGSSTGYTGPMMDVLVEEAKKRGYEPDAVVCSTDVPAGRPYPWMCYLNAIKMKVYPFEAMVKIGDTISDIQEGLNAGMWTIGITRSGNELGLTKQQADQLEPSDLKQRLQNINKRFIEEGAHYTSEGIWKCVPIIDKINDRLSRGERPSRADKE